MNPVGWPGDMGPATVEDLTVAPKPPGVDYQNRVIEDEKIVATAVHILPHVGPEATAAYLASVANAL